MTDRELLELAAKAAGLVGELHILTGDCIEQDEPGGFRYQHQDGGHEWWNPLTDDGDALRLAVKLQMTVCNEHVNAGCAYCQCTENEDVMLKVSSGSNESEVIDSDYAATRRAIVLLAAEIGRTMGAGA